jgi:hypothetical protein
MIASKQLSHFVANTAGGSSDENGLRRHAGNLKSPVEEWSRRWLALNEKSAGRSARAH